MPGFYTMRTFPRSVSGRTEAGWTGRTLPLAI